MPVDGPPYWSFDASETEESTKYTWVVAVGHEHFVLSPVSLTSRNQHGGTSNSTIGIYDLTETVREGSHVLSSRLV